MAGHDSRSSTWMTEDLIDVFGSMNRDPKSIVKHWLFELWIPVVDEVGEEVGHSVDRGVAGGGSASDDVANVDTGAETDDSTAQEIPSTAAAATAAAAESDSDRRASLPDKTGGAAAAKSKTVCASQDGGGREHDTVWKLAAVTAGMSAGSNFHDYSMCTFVRDSRCLGHVLTKTVADLLQKCGFDLWYWGYKGEYMAQYDQYVWHSPLAGGETLSLS